MLLDVCRLVFLLLCVACCLWCGIGVRCLLFVGFVVGGCSLFVGGCSVVGVCCMVFIVCCLLLVVCCLLMFDACCLMCGVHCLWLFVVRCRVFGVS